MRRLHHQADRHAHPGRAHPRTAVARAPRPALPPGSRRRVETVPAAELEALRRRFLQRSAAAGPPISDRARRDFRCRRRGPRRPPVGGHRRTAGLPGDLPPGARSGRGAARAARRFRAGARGAHQSPAGLHHPARSDPASRCRPPFRELLQGQCVAAAGLPAGEAHRLRVALERAGGHGLFFAPGTPPAPEQLAACRLLAVYIARGATGSPWLDAAAAIRCPPS